MKNRWLLSGFSLLLLVFASCGSRETVKPRYQLELNRTLTYRLAGNVDLNIDAGFLKYSGKVGITADVTMTAVETNAYGYKIILDISNASLTGADQQLTAFFNIGVNYFRTWLSTMLLSDRGRVNIMVGTNVVIGLNSYSQLLFPDFSDMDNIWIGNTETTNYPAKFQDQQMTIVYTRMWKVSKMEGFNLFVDSRYQFMTYDREDYLKSVEPQPLGNMTLTLSDIFNVLSGKMTSKNGKIQLSMNLVFRQDILSYIISVQSNGDLTLTLVDKPA